MVAVQLRSSRCAFLTSPRHRNPDARAAGISRYPTGLPNTDGSLLPEAREACLARSLSDGPRIVKYHINRLRDSS